MNLVKPALCLKSKILGQPVDVATLGGGKRRGELIFFLIVSVSEILEPQVYGHPEVFRHGNRRIKAAPTSSASPRYSFFTTSSSPTFAALAVLSRSLPGHLGQVRSVRESRR